MFVSVYVYVLFIKSTCLDSRFAIHLHILSTLLSVNILVEFD